MSLESEGIPKPEFLNRIPAFSGYLGNIGNVRIVDFGESERRSLRDMQVHHGLKMRLYIDDIYLGFIEFYDSRHCCIFEGKVPTHPTKNFKARLQLSWDEVYGRMDNWSKIPFP